MRTGARLAVGLGVAGAIVGSLMFAGQLERIGGPRMAGDFRMLSGAPTLAPVVSKALPAVVSIAVKSNETLDPSEDIFFRDPRERHGLPRQKHSGGSGVIVDAAKGYILTNAHVVAGAFEIVVTLNDKREVPAKLLGIDPPTDIALLEIRARGLSAVEIGNSSEMQVGDYVLAIGSPFGLGQTVTAGMISAVGRSGLNLEGYEDFIQTDAAINPGNSGGALVNMDGELIGINTAIIGPGGGNVGLGFAVPTRLAANVLTHLVKNGHVERGRIGLQTTDLTPLLAENLVIDRKAGALVNKVEKDMPCAKAGLLPGDLIVAVDSRPVGNAAALRNYVGFVAPGHVVTVIAVRDGAEQSFQITVAPLADDETALASAEIVAEQRLAGAEFSIEDGAGLRVVEVESGSAASRLGLRSGDIIKTVNRKAIENVATLTGLLETGARQTVLFIRRGEDEFLLIV